MKRFHTTHPPSGHAWMTTRQAAAHCSCAEKTIERSVRRGHLEALRLANSKRYRFRREWLDAWLQGGAADTESGTHPPE